MLLCFDLTVVVIRRTTCGRLLPVLSFVYLASYSQNACVCGCLCACVRACARACARACVCVCVCVRARVICVRVQCMCTCGSACVHVSVRATCMLRGGGETESHCMTRNSNSGDTHQTTQVCLPHFLWI